MIDGARTRDPKDHNLVLYQLSYDHRLLVMIGRFYRSCRKVQGLGFPVFYSIDKPRARA